MDLISCDNCAVVLDADKLDFPYYVRDEDGCIDDTKAKYRPGHKGFFAFLSCPVCKSDIFSDCCEQRNHTIKEQKR